MHSRKLSNKLNKIVKYSALFGLLLLATQEVFASSGGQSLSDIVNNVQTNIKTLAPLLAIISYIAGIAFAIAGIVKFKAHKDNPSQVALSQAIVYLGVGAALIFLPMILQSAGSTVFGGQATSAGGATTGVSQ